jgi:hypothetical protein
MTQPKPENLKISSWNCPLCTVRGTIRISKNEIGATYFQRLIDLHKLSSPYCKGKEIKIG